MLFWDRLILEIHQLTLAGERIPIPEPTRSVGPWSRASVLFEKLRDRAAAEERRAVQHDPALKNDQREWDQYVQDRQTVAEMLQRGIFDRDTLVEHLDLKLPGDLKPPTPVPLSVRPHENLCPTMQTLKNADCTCIGRIPEDREADRHPEWKQRAARLASALHWWNMLDAPERSAIKQERAMRQLQGEREVAERTSDWEQVNSVPPVWRHRGRGSLWVVGEQLVYLPDASLSDVVALMKSVGEIGKPVVVEPVKPAAPIVEYPKWVQPHPSWISHPSGPPFVEGYKFSVDRDTERSFRSW